MSTSYEAVAPPAYANAPDQRASSGDTGAYPDRLSQPAAAGVDYADGQSLPETAGRDTRSVEELGRLIVQSYAAAVAETGRAVRQGAPCGEGSDYRQAWDTVHQLRYARTMAFERRADAARPAAWPLAAIRRAGSLASRAAGMRPH